MLIEPARGFVFCNDREDFDRFICDVIEYPYLTDPKSMDPNPAARARHLRRDSTKVERLLWQRLRNRQLRVKFRRQHSIGPFIAGFCCIERFLVVELDGDQHAFQSDQDAARSAYLADQGYRVIRFWNHEVLYSLDNVIDRITTALTTLLEPQ